MKTDIIKEDDDECMEKLSKMLITMRQNENLDHNNINDNKIEVDKRKGFVSKNTGRGDSEQRNDSSMLEVKIVKNNLQTTGKKG